ncbi:hypothetical protein CHS0354_019732 [Potamilus streckersoni]|uniref:BTB domain-containing protein n=1 Tax=Potamilus streckersoni TaxID=2493646 RepID=A0AAE0S9K9_9BIVA|nr:hypothetical protein CHS0354_019732 [Potamilus streckersoni]
MSSNTHQITLLEGLRSLYRDGTLTDVVLVSGDSKISCHRVVLAASSPYFRAMFTIPVKESIGGEVEIHDVAPQTLHAIVNYLYTGEITLTNENVQDIIMVATMWELPSIVNMCGEHMSQELCLSNCVDVFSFASHFICHELMETSKSFILDHFSEIVCNNDRLSNLTMQQFLELVSSDMLCVSSEEVVYKAVIRWVQQDVENRKQYLPDLFHEIRLPLISDEFIEGTMKAKSLLMNDTCCRDRIIRFTEHRNLLERSSLDYIEALTNPEQDAVGKEFCNRPRLGMYNRKMIVFAGGAFGPNERSFGAFDHQTKFNYFSIKPHPTFDFKYKIEFYQLVTTDENEIFFIGGIFFESYHFQDSGPALADVFQYSMKDVKWLKRSSMNYPRCCFSASCTGSRIYVMGGKASYPRGQPLDCLECYIQEKDVWQQLSSAPVPLYRHSATIYKDGIFVFGGICEEQYMDTVLRYSIQSDEWTLVKTEMVNTRADFAAVTFKDKIYLVGGASEHQNIVSVEIYHPDQNRWTYGEEFPEERKNFWAVLMDESIYVCGGVRHLGPVRGRKSRQVESRDLYRYDIVKNKWNKEVRLVQFGMYEIYTVANINVKFLQKSDMVSSV